MLCFIQFLPLQFHGREAEDAAIAVPAPGPHPEQLINKARWMDTLQLPLIDHRNLFGKDLQHSSCSHHAGLKILPSKTGFDPLTRSDQAALPAEPIAHMCELDSLQNQVSDAEEQKKVVFLPVVCFE